MTVAPALSEEQLAGLLRLLDEVDSVELKLTIAEEARRSAVQALGMDPLEAQIRQVTFFDTPGLDLSAAGVVLRARRVQRRRGDMVVKLRPVDPADVPASLRTSKDFSIEVDAMPGGFVCSASMKSKVEDSRIREVWRGDAPLSSLLSKRQRRLYAEHAPSGIGVDDVVPLGPITLMKLTFAAEGLPRPMVAELWFYPDGSQILELSTKCAPAEAFRAAAETRVFLGSRGVDQTAPQQTKTRAAMEFFAAELR
jgi:hypothetical protein